MIFNPRNSKLGVPKYFPDTSRIKRRRRFPKELCPSCSAGPFGPKALALHRRDCDKRNPNLSGGAT
jgi:hypothetical protein